MGYLFQMFMAFSEYFNFNVGKMKKSGENAGVGK